MRRFLLLFCCLLAFLLPARPCAWDRDTLATEVKGMPGVLEVITGRFERNPPLYYEMRLARVSKELATQPAKLELYDDAGVASDRLHKSKNAIAWMNKKRARLMQIGFTSASKEHWYRYHANLGTFLAHDWLRSGANRKNLWPMLQARGHIKRAIEINPDAHFGREEYQLKAMEWILNPSRNKEFAGMPVFLTYKEIGSGKAAHKTVEGLSGLIVLGNAWESVDVFATLAQALQRDDHRSVVAYAAALRANELVGKGRRSLAPSAPQGANLKAIILNPVSNYLRDPQEVTQQFKELRNEADSWQAQRTDYMMSRLESGLHPDTNSDFWKDWREPEPPAIYRQPSPRRFWAFAILFAAVAISLFALAAANRRKRRVIAA